MSEPSSKHPYLDNIAKNFLENLDKKNWLEDGALCLVEMRRDEFLTSPVCYEKYDERAYGLAKIMFYRYNRTAGEK